MAVAQRMGRPVPPLILLALVVVALVVGTAVLMFNWITSSSPVTVSYSQFLADVEHGSVSSVTQIGETLTVVGPGGTYEVTLPSLLTDVYADVEQAAGDGGARVPTFQAQPAPDTGWIGIGLTALLPLAVVLVVFVLVLMLIVRPARLGDRRSLTDRLRELDEAHRAGLISDDERARQRARMLDEA